MDKIYTRQGGGLNVGMKLAKWQVVLLKGWPGGWLLNQNQTIKIMIIWKNITHGITVETQGKGYLMTFKSGSEPMQFATIKQARKEYKSQLAMRSWRS